MSNREYSRDQRNKVISLMCPRPGHPRYRVFFDGLEVGKTASIVFSDQAPPKLRAYWNSTWMSLQVRVLAKSENPLGAKVAVGPLVGHSEDRVAAIRESWPDFPKLLVTEEMIRLSPSNDLSWGHEIRGRIKLDDSARILLSADSGDSEVVAEKLSQVLGSFDVYLEQKKDRYGRSLFKQNHFKPIASFIDETEQEPIMGKFYRWEFFPDRVGDTLEACLLNNLSLGGLFLRVAVMVASGRPLGSDIPRQMMEISTRKLIDTLNRDSFQCVTCRARPSNAEYFPLQVIQIRRAPKRKAIPLENLSTMCDSCIADLNNHQSMRLDERRVPARLRWEVLSRDNFTCRYCGRSQARYPGLELHVDHVVPWSKGGETTIENLVTACQDCNLGKSDSALLVE